MHDRGHGHKIDVIIDANREEVLAKLKQNRSDHKANFDAAHSNWKDALDIAIGQWHHKLKDLIHSGEFAEEEFRSAFLDKGHSILESPAAVRKLLTSVPTSYEEEYNDVIEMFEMDTKETIKVDRGSFKKFIHDDWDWKSGEVSKSTYVLNYLNDNSGN